MSTYVPHAFIIDRTHDCIFGCRSSEHVHSPPEHLATKKQWDEGKGHIRITSRFVTSIIYYKYHNIFSIPCLLDYLPLAGFCGPNQLTFFSFFLQKELMSKPVKPIACFVFCSNVQFSLTSSFVFE